MRVSLVVAMAENRIIGRDQGLPWHLPADLAHFKAVTMGSPMIMGRKTHASIGRALPGRENAVITRDPRRVASGCAAVASLGDALARHADCDEVMIIGGGEVYRAAEAHAQRIYLTLVHAWPQGDTRFPDLDPSEWHEVEREERAPDAKNAYAMSFVVLARIAHRTASNTC